MSPRINSPLALPPRIYCQVASVPFVLFGDYEEMGIKEYWIVDYQPFGAGKFVGEPKQPTISVCSLIGDEYEINQFRNNEPIISQIFPELNLTAHQILLTAD